MLKGKTIWNNLQSVGITFCIIESEQVHRKEKHDMKQFQGRDNMEQLTACRNHHRE